MTFDLVKIFHDMGLFAQLIAVGLSLMAVATLAVFVERMWTFRRARVRSLAFGEIAKPMLEERRYDELLERTADFKGSPLAQTVSYGLKTYLAALRRPGKVTAVELTRRELERRAEGQTAEVRRGLSMIASVGSIAPFVGLLGTVVGIISAFQGIAKEGSGGLGAVSSGISEALIETAFGLLVAIPAVLVFNYLNGRADQMLTALDEARGELIDEIESTAGPVVLNSIPEQEVDLGAA